MGDGQPAGGNGARCLVSEEASATGSRQGKCVAPEFETTAVRARREAQSRAKGKSAGLAAEMLKYRLEKRRLARGRVWRRFDGHFALPAHAPVVVDAAKQRST